MTMKDTWPNGAPEYTAGKGAGMEASGSAALQRRVNELMRKWPSGLEAHVLKSLKRYISRVRNEVPRRLKPALIDSAQRGPEGPHYPSGIQQFSASVIGAPFKTARQSDEMPSYEMGLLLTMGPGFTTIRP
jgi:hypothetical protein